MATCKECCSTGSTECSSTVHLCEHHPISCQCVNGTTLLGRMPITRQIPIAEVIRQEYDDVWRGRISRRNEVAEEAHNDNEFKSHPEKGRGKCRCSFITLTNDISENSYVALNVNATCSILTMHTLPNKNFITY